MSVSAPTLYLGGLGWINGFTISTSGLRDASLRMDVATNNVANANTDGFIPNRVDSNAHPTSGVTSGVRSTLDTYTYQNLQQVSEETKTPVPSQTEHVTECINLMLAKHAFYANARALKSGSDTTHTMVNLLG